MDETVPPPQQTKSIAALLSESLGVSPEVQLKLLASVVIVGLILLLRHVLLRVALGRTADHAARYRWRKTSAMVASLLALMAVARVWVEALSALTTYLGLLSAGVAIALKDPLTNLAGWLFIVWRKPFQLGDRIQVGGVAGDVIDIRPFQFSLLEIGGWVNADQSTGRIVHVPNARVFTETQANYSQGFDFIWNEVPVLLTFESDWRKAKEILTRIAERHGTPASQAATEQVARAAHRYFIFYKTLTPTVYTAVRDSGVELTIRHLCNPRERRAVSQTIWEDILEEFGRCPDIDFAYPTQRWYDNAREGKEASNPAPGQGAAAPDSPDR